MSENAIFYLFAGLYVLNVLLSIALIGRPRDPHSPSTAIAAIFSGGLYLWGTYVLWVN